MADVLAQIVAHKWTEIAAAKARTPLSQLEAQLANASQPRGFARALRTARRIGLIAEVKKGSPSAGTIRPDFDPVEIGKTYAAHGAHCLSVLTDEHFFQGHLSYLTNVRRAVEIPVLRKDFILDEYQVVEARVAGADAVLLIAECLTQDRLSPLYRLITDLGMDALIEIYDVENLARVLELQPPLLGVNNRDLRTFKVDLGHTLAVAKGLPPETLLVSESGIRTADEVEYLVQGGAGAILVGETLMKSPDIGAAVLELMKPPDL